MGSKSRLNALKRLQQLHIVHNVAEVATEPESTLAGSCVF